MNHIVVFRTHRFGDILQTHPLIQGFRETYPQAHITFILDEIYAELMQKSNLADTVIGIPYARMFAGIPDQSLSETQVKTMCEQFMGQLIRRPVDLAINRSFSNFSALFLKQMSPAKIIGKQYQEYKGFGYDPITARFMQNLIQNRTVEPLHLADIGCRLAGVEPASPRFQFYPDKNDETWWKRVHSAQGIGQQDVLIGIQMGANKQFRHWGISGFATFIHELLQDKPDSVHVKFVFFGSREERTLFQEIVALLEKKIPVINLIGETTFGQLAIALSHCHALLTGDTGTMHLATAVETPVLALFYASAYYPETGPYGDGHLVIAPNIECYPCFEPEKCPYQLACRSQIAVPAVVTAMRFLLGWDDQPSWFYSTLHLFQSKISSIPCRLTFQPLRASSAAGYASEKY
ncbi:glycosyltransferase family 9 protein [candidate division KSB1 bacterium]|nr:glycosyltransferase family 9 protein [candidate division KSB1 bacterium]